MYTSPTFYILSKGPREAGRTVSSNFNSDFGRFLHILMIYPFITFINGPLLEILDPPWLCSGGSRISQGSPTAKGVHQPITWPIFPRKLHEIKEIGPRGGACASHPQNPPMLWCDGKIIFDEVISIAFFPSMSNSELKIHWSTGAFDVPWTSTTSTTTVQCKTTGSD